MKTAIALLSLGAALACEASPPGLTDISAEELLAIAPSSPLILDVRTEEEFTGGHVPGAVNISHTELASRLGELANSKDRSVVVYCERGGRAGKAASVLLKAGFSDVRHLAGDMSGWRASNRPLER